MDAGSIPASSTNTQNPNPYRLGFFCPIVRKPAWLRGFATSPFTSSLLAVMQGEDHGVPFMAQIIGLEEAGFVGVSTGLAMFDVAGDGFRATLCCCTHSALMKSSLPS
ncbi:MAG: hypothetical protein Q4G39_06410 [Brachymonas sp.]|nr:hypothetical protein [Brachymonas sp.]